MDFLPEDMESEPQVEVETEAEPEVETDLFSEVATDDLSDELQELHKQLQGDYTRKTQDLATQRKDLEGLQAKADQLDQFLKDPEHALRAMVGARQANAPPQGEGWKNPYGEIPEDNRFDTGTDQAVKATSYDMAVQFFQSEVMPIFKQYAEKIHQMETAQADGVWSGLKEQHGEVVSSHMAEAKALVAKGLTPKQALYAVAGEQLTQSKPKQAKIKGVTLTRASSLPASQVNGKGKNAEDLVRHFGREFGISFPSG